MMLLHSPLRFAVCLVLASGAVHAQDGFVGLPTTGKVDDSRVVSARHGTAAPEQAKEGPGKPVSAPAASRKAAIPAGGITGVAVENTGGEQTKVPLTFGQVFAPGDLPRGAGLSGKLADGSTLPLQVDVKATHPDGSVRHAVISALLPRLAKGQGAGIALVKGGARSDDARARPDLDSGASVAITIDGERYTASADRLLKEQKPQVWLNGPVVTELQVAAPLRNAKGEEHPHLAARFAIRSYAGTGKTRVDVVVENNWAYEAAPQNFTYDVELKVGDGTVYAKKNLTHLHHARWRTLAWRGAAPAVHLRHDTAYLIASRALPNYDRSVVVSDAALATLMDKFDGSSAEPMGVGAASPAMPNTGGRNDIGLLPGWAAMYLLSMDPRAKQVTLGTADLAGSWSVHYRDKRTALPVSLMDYPYMTILGNPGDTRNPKTGKQEGFPRCAPDACKTPYKVDSAHQPAFAYLPYLVTGDHYYLEELQFWAMWNVFYSNPGYRKNIRGLVEPHQVRGQAWSLRTLAEAAYVTPDSHPLKRDFLAILKSNLDYYNALYSDNPAANRLGVVDNKPAVVYKGKTAVAPWQDDFFTSAVGHVAELGFKDAQPLLKWKAKFPIARMVGAGACWVDGANYTITVRDSPGAPIYDSIAQAYRSTMGELAALPCAGPELAAATKRQVGDMGGYAGTPIGFPSNMQPALAYAADVGGEAGRKAWARFMSRSVKPDYSKAPQFAIVPRSIDADDAR
ncbi:MAG: hypothetical protein AB1807_02660 [Pseudomonadota bacterium]